MSGQVNEAITVQLNQSRSRILSFHWRDRSYQVQELGQSWTEPRRWWRGESERTWFQVNAQGRIYELYLDHASRQWYLGFARG